MKTKVVSWKNLPTRPPTTLTMVAWLMLDRLHVSGWVWGCIGSMLFLLWLSFIVSCFKEDTVDIFEKGEK